MTPEEQRIEDRFQRIERNLERVGERMDQFTVGMQEVRAAHMEVETAQLSQAKAHERLVAVVEGLGEKLGNLTILVDRLIARDLGGNGHL